MIQCVCLFFLWLLILYITILFRKGFYFVFYVHYVINTDLARILYIRFYEMHLLYVTSIIKAYNWYV